MSYTTDANILLYAANIDSPYHRQARSFIQSCAEGSESWFLTWHVVHAFVRIATHGKIMEKPLAPGDAIAFVDQILELPHVQTIGESEPVFWATYKAEITTAHLRGNQIPDAIIVSVMKTHGVRTIYTKDRDFLRFAGIKVIDPLQ